MKSFMITTCAFIFIIGCNNPAATKEGAGETPASTEKIDHAYLPEDHPADFWDRGDQKNAALVLKALKAFESGNIEEALAPFADSVTWRFDNFDAKISKDSMRSMFKDAWKNMNAMKVIMNDFESVISKDKKEEYVTLWYKQIMTDKTGKVDSVAYVDDLKIENGKITVLDEKTRKFPVKK